jgi:O-antigen/teichoic acid export membrane protein
VNVSQRVLYNTIVQIAGKAALLVSSLVTLRLATTYLGVDGFGEYAIVLALAPILLVFGDLGIATLLSRELVHKPELREELAATLLWIRLAASGVLLVLCLAIAPFLPYDREVRVGFVIACLGVTLLSVGSFAVPFFQVNLRLDIVALLDACTAALTVGLMLTVTQLDLGFFALVGVNVALGLVSAVASLILVRRFWRPRLRFNRALAGPLLRDGLPLGAVIVLGLLHFKVDSILLSLMRSPEEVGTYTVAYRFLEQSLVLPGVFMAAVFPLLALALRTGNAEDVIRKAFSFLLLVAVPLAVGLVVLAGPLVALVAGDGFEDSVVPLRILAPALVVAFVNVVFASVLIALNRQRALILVSLAGLTLNVLVNLWAIPRFGYNGAAVTTVVSETIGFCAVFVLAKRSFPFQLSPRLVTRADVALLLGR